MKKPEGLLQGWALEYSPSQSQWHIDLAWKAAVRQSREIVKGPLWNWYLLGVFDSYEAALEHAHTLRAAGVPTRGMESSP